MTARAAAVVAGIIDRIENRPLGTGEQDARHRHLGWLEHVIWGSPTRFHLAGPVAAGYSPT